MYIVFDLSDESGDKRTEYVIKDATYIPRKGEIIELRNGIPENCLHGRFKVSEVEYETSQSDMKEDLSVGKGKLLGVRIYAKQMKY